MQVVVPWHEEEVSSDTGIKISIIFNTCGIFDVNGINESIFYFIFAYNIYFFEYDLYIYTIS